MAEIPEGTDDLAKVQDFIKDQVNTYFQESVAKQQQASPAAVQQQEEAGQKQLRELITPFVKPDLDEARFVAADAQDYVKFYTGNPDAVEYQERVEKAFEALKKANRPTGRGDILDYLIGQEYRTDKDKFVEKASEKKKQQLDRAEAASDFGSSSLTRAKSDPVWSQFDKLSSEDMEKALDGVTF